MSILLTRRAVRHLDPIAQSLLLIVDDIDSYHLQISGRVAIEIQHPGIP